MVQMRSYELFPFCDFKYKKILYLKSTKIDRTLTIARVRAIIYAKYKGVVLMKKRILVLVLTVAMLLQSVPLTAKADNMKDISLSVSENILSENGLSEAARDIESFVPGHIPETTEELPTSYLPKEYKESIKAERASDVTQRESSAFLKSFIS